MFLNNCFSISKRLFTKTVYICIGITKETRIHGKTLRYVYCCLVTMMTNWHCWLTVLFLFLLFVWDRTANRSNFLPWIKSTTIAGNGRSGEGKLDLRIVMVDYLDLYTFCKLSLYPLHHCVDLLFCWFLSSFPLYFKALVVFIIHVFLCVCVGCYVTICFLTSFVLYKSSKNLRSWRLFVSFISMTQIAALPFCENNELASCFSILSRQVNEFHGPLTQSHWCMKRWNQQKESFLRMSQRHQIDGTARTHVQFVVVVG